MSGKPNRKMPARKDLGRHCMSTMSMPMHQWKNWKMDPGAENPAGLRAVMGYALPTWQRGLVWSDAQKIAFIESAWSGIPLGTYSFNRSKLGSPFDNLLIDGQQRMNALQCYLNDEFSVFGYRWSEVTNVDRRFWEMGASFPCFITETEDEAYLRRYYDLMNFGGVAHEDMERATLKDTRP